MSRKTIDKCASFLLWSSASFIVFILLSIIVYIMIEGMSAISWEFITQPPRDSMTKGGISTPIIGTLQLIMVSMFFAIPVGVITGIFFAEYAENNTFTSVLRICVRCLAGVPSVVYGLFGLSLFVIFMKLGSSLLSAGLTLACLSLPLIVTASETAFMTVPENFRLASYALGASKWQTICKVILPAATPTIITGSILSIGRVAGETAPIIFTGAAFFTPHIAQNLFQEVMALPYHIMVLATAGTNIEQTRPIQYGTVLVLIALVMGISSIGVFIRTRLRNR